MYIEFIFRMYKVYDLTSDRTVCDCLKTREEAKDRIRQDDNERRMLRQKAGRPFEHHKYMISEAVGYAEGDVDDGYELSFDELCNACYDWRFSDYCEVYNFEN